LRGKTSSWIFTLFAACVLVSSPVLAGSDTRTTVLELFTSQGCSSCPSADLVLGEYAQRDDIIALSFHVDYWDYIGWKDTFASKETTDRQRGYGRALGQRHLYTPEMVVGGRAHAVGANRSGVDKLIGDELRTPPSGVALDLKVTEGQAVAALSSKSAVAAEVWLFEIDRRHDVEIARGENTGNVLTYHNVVRTIRSLGRWDGKRRQISEDLKAARRAGRDGIVVVVQTAGQGPVLAAARVWLTAPGSG